MHNVIQKSEILFKKKGKVLTLPKQTIKEKFLEPKVARNRYGFFIYEPSLYVEHEILPSRESASKIKSYRNTVFKRIAAS